MFTIKFHKNILYIFFIILHNMWWNVAHQCPTWVDLCFFSTIVSLRMLSKGALPSQSSHCLLAALLAMPTLASSSARSFLIIAHSCFALRSRMERCGHGCGFQVISLNIWPLRWYDCTLRHFPRKPEVLCFAGTFRLICLRQEEMTSDRWLVRRWYIETRKFQSLRKSHGWYHSSRWSTIISSCLRRIKRKVPAKHSTSGFRGKNPEVGRNVQVYNAVVKYSMK